MRIVLSYQSGIPVYEQIKEQIKRAILSGELAENEALPSIRVLAKDLNVSVMTTSRAYSDLELEGFVKTLPKKGVYVKKADIGLLKGEYLKEAKALMLTAVQKGRLAGLTIGELHKLLDETEAETE